MKKLLLFFLTILLFSTAYTQLSDPPKREFRSAWIATVANLDWPTRGASAASQKQALVNILDFLGETGINAVVFQIRTECDAFYNSQYEPWSYYLTGTQGADPGYDPLQFAIEETHIRGMELHAWFNPYRAILRGSSYQRASSHVSVQHPDWLIASRTEPGYHFLNPGKQDVRDYVTNVVMDVVKRYDVDGIHMDDYFYPYGGMWSEDSLTFRDESRGFADTSNWRRNNVNILLEQINDSVSSIKPHVKFGMSPFGIWKNGVPPGITGLDAYNRIYADAMAWLRMQSIDYLTPQLYWKIGGSQDYNKLSAWWADSTNKYNRHLYPGHAVYKMTALQNPFAADEIQRQIRINRANPKIDGSVFFRTGNMTDKGFNDSLRTDLYRYKALLPVMSWKDNVVPNPVQNLRFERLSPTEPSALIWDKPAAASDGDTAYRYVVYRFNSPTVTQADIDNPANILIIENNSYTFPPVPSESGPFFFVVTALDRNWNESEMSTVLQVGGPEIPVPAFPSNTSESQRDTVTLKWNASDLASSYYVQVSGDPSFGGEFIISGIEVQDTFLTVTGFEGEKTYYWRLSSKNAGGVSSYSEVFSFTTGFPVTPVPLEPAHQSLNVPTPVNVRWQANNNTDSYRLQLSSSLDFTSQFIIMDVSDISDTSYTFQGLEKNKIYFWRVSAVNQYGSSLWSVKFGFKTESATGLEFEESVPSDYLLNQNYPNPFNPSTRISFELPTGGFTTLKVYDAVGNEVAELVNDDLPTGKFTINYDASGISSGVYFYILRSGNRMLSSKMILMK